jgi:hypothetical protein
MISHSYQRLLDFSNLLILGNALMSTPEALPMEIALIALPLFEFQVYSTSLYHYYHMALINALRLPLKKFFCPQDWHLTHTQYSLTQPQLPRVQSQHLPSTSISFPELIFTSIACIKSHGTHLQQYCSHHQFSSSIMEQPSE